jgi:hypothetical protein
MCLSQISYETKFTCKVNKNDIDKIVHVMGVIEDGYNKSSLW